MDETTKRGFFFSTFLPYLLGIPNGASPPKRQGNGASPSSPSVCKGMRSIQGTKTRTVLYCIFDGSAHGLCYVFDHLKMRSGERKADSSGHAIGP